MTGREAIVKTLMDELGITKEEAQRIVNSTPQPANIDRDIGTEEEIEAKMAEMKMSPAAQARFDELFGGRAKRPPAGPTGI
jgi:hypothetical protein